MPTLPDEMPFVQVRFRKYKKHAPLKALFEVDVQALRLAFAWLKRHNPYYQEVEWNENAAPDWETAHVVIGVVREANNEDGQQGDYAAPRHPERSLVCPRYSGP